MRWLQEEPAPEELDRITELLERNGVPIYVSARLPRGGPSGLFVCLDEQYDDAVALLRNPHHKVTNPVDVADYYERMDEAVRQSPLSMPTMISIIVAMVIIVAIIVVVRTHA